MSIEIRVFTVPGEGDEAEQVRAAMAAIGFAPAPFYGSIASAMNAPYGAEPQLDPHEGGINKATLAAAEAEANTPKRERGQPSPGKARRTKAEIAEDDAAEAADTPDVVNGEDTMNESVGPTDSPDDAAQDAADEAAEVDASRDTDAPLTVDDLKDVMGDYVSKFTMEATKEDGPRIFNDALGRPPEGEAAWKASLIAGLGQDHLRKAIAAWASAAASDDRYSKGA